MEIKRPTAISDAHVATPPSRRNFISTAVASSMCLASGALSAIEPFGRRPRIRGVGLSAYSLKSKMRWWRGKETQGDVDILGFLDYCGQLDLDGAELTSYFFPAPLERSYLNRVRRRAFLQGLDISGGAIGNNLTHPPGSDAAQAQLEYTQLWIDRFADLGAPFVRVFAGQPQAGADRPQVIRNVLANLGVALAHAERRGVMLAIENHDFTTNLDDLLQIVEAVDSDWFGINWDSANLAPTPDPYAELARIAPYAITAQIKVMIRAGGKKVPADFGRLVEILRAAGYRGYLTLEYEEAEDPQSAIPKYIKQLRTALGDATGQDK